MVSLARSASIPLAVVVAGVVIMTGPSGPVRSLLMILGLGAFGLTLLAVVSWWQASDESRRKVPAAKKTGGA
jgi:uncharacterized protein involved in exopolysaccharide biosynthesis